MNQQNSTTRRLFIGLAVGAIFGLGVGLAIGLFFAYVIAPVQWTDGEPQDLRVDYAAYYWQWVAKSYSENGDLELARTQLGEWDNEKRLQKALDRAYFESGPEVQQSLDTLEQEITGAAPEPEATAAPGETAEATPEVTPSGGLPLGSILAGFLLVAAFLAIIAMLVVRMRKRREVPARAELVEEAPEWLATLHPEEGAEAAPALGHFVTSYALGNDTYDESFSVETDTGEFLGECGVGISETIGAGDPDQVTAFEVWLFDKNDIRTVTKVLMSEYAFNDPDLRASLASKGEPVLAEVNEPISLETATLRLDVMITERIYGAGAQPPNSHFERLTVELVSRAKEADDTEAPNEDTEFIA